VTYSIVARDPVTGQLGVAAQSCYFALGSVLPWARAGVGAVATQSMVDPGYGPRCLDLLAQGVPVADALEQVRAADPGREVRQVGLVDIHGQVASFTGSRCIDEVSEARGNGYTAQANMMRGPGVCPAMAHAFETTPGSLASRLMAALVAAEGAGGDGRGVMSAALQVVDAEPRDHPWEGVLVDVRVDHHDDPLGELDRLLRVAEAYHHCDLAEEALVRGDTAMALAESQAALALLPGEGNFMLSYIGALASTGRVAEAATAAQDLVRRQPGWDGMLRAIVARGLVPLPEGVTIEALLEEAP
jgi:uncharacterized Ntn-hydrolase superfamily protein